MHMNYTKKLVWAGVVIGALLIGAAGVFAFSLGKYEKIKANNGTVAIPVSRLSGDKARFYRFDDGGKSIAFFVVKAPDGSYRTAFDACDVCYRDKKGYEQQGNQMLCKNCNKKFAIDRIGPNSGGGCNPSFLPHQVSGGAITIKAADLKAGARFF
ncbi:DUF2318 domain-containing protein [Oryzomonas sagensis]|uniref:DUF2318 domain-containing protein n=1 Tax=Oryzomonas sagensis TaxID=2603857 RepID=A0ABQ6TQ26_9BACT|nr:DUF2318 domain-containing protein [Oryzomonas sagensis]KAB0671133.1 DUF2318 domain-containing protein [Oryzomonas sagensis]